jgi:protein-tyrosine phosphatase
MTEDWSKLADFILDLPEKKEKKEIKKEQCPVCYLHFSDLNEHKSKHMSKITENLYIGNSNNAEDIYELNYYDINVIINTAQEHCRIAYQYDKLEKYVKYYILDTDDFPIDKYFNETSDLINFYIKQKKNVLVHCIMGRSRSVSIVLAYLIKYYEDSEYKKMTFEEGLKLIKLNRSIACPNNGFIEQLKNYSSKLSTL